MTLQANFKYLKLTALLTVGLGVSVQAKTDASFIAKLGNELTCSGSEKAGGDGVAAYTGKWKGAPPGTTSVGGVTGNPYDSEQPTIITAANMAAHAAKLTDGQEALFKKYPDYKMYVYPSHRDFDTSISISCENTKKSAANAELIDGGAGMTGAVYNGIPFPQPKSGLEAIWNQKNRAYYPGEYFMNDQAAVQPSGGIAWGREEYTVSLPQKPGSAWNDDDITVFFKQQVLKPERDHGMWVTGWYYGHFDKHPAKAWQYQPGTRRTRELPEFGYDFPRGPGGLRTVDDDRLFNGSPDRYNWTYLGKKVLYVPYNSYNQEDPNLKYADLLTPKFPNPKYGRWEAHRVLVIDAKLKPGARHNYARRVIYLDEDTLAAVASDYYDARGQLWRTAWQNSVFSDQSKSYVERGAFYIDLNSGAYFADRMWQESGKKPTYLGISTNPNDYGANALRAIGK